MPRPRQSRTRRPGRPQAPPPVLRRRAAEPFEGADLLEEVRREQGALVLWQALRDVLLWACAPPEARTDGLFAPEAAAAGARLEAGGAPDPEVARPLRELSALCADPAAARPAAVAEACRAVSRWAEARGLPRAALAYAYAAAVAVPGSADDAYRVGLLSRREADHSRAEAWLRRAAGLARRADAPRSHALALVGLGNLFLQRGDYPRAEGALRKALGIARRHGVREVRAMALHDLLVVMLETSRFEQAERYARLAFRAYGPRHPRLPMLAHDVAGFWLMQGKYDQALEAFRAVLALAARQEDQLWVLGNVARAAGGAGRRDAFTGAWVDAWRIIDARPVSASTGPALLNMAHGAALLGDWERVEMASSLAVATAARRREGRVGVEAEILLRAARDRRLPETGEVPLYPPVDGDLGETLAVALVEAIEGMRG